MIVRVFIENIDINYYVCCNGNKKKIITLPLLSYINN